jgi:hypothetical protein
MLKLDDNFCVLSRGEQVARMVDYATELTQHRATPEPSFIPDFMTEVARHYTWQSPETLMGSELKYNRMVQNVIESLLVQDADRAATVMLGMMKNSQTDAKVRRLALGGLHMLATPNLQVELSDATTYELAETLAEVVLSHPHDKALTRGCLTTATELLEQGKVGYVERFAEAANDSLMEPETAVAAQCLKTACHRMSRRLELN